MQNDSAKWVDILASVAHSKTFTKGEHVFYALTPAEKFFYIIEGEVRIYKLDSSGQEIEVRRAFAGDIFAEVLVFAGINYPVSAQAVKPSKVISYNKQEVYALTQHDNRLAFFFIETLARRCLFLNQAIDNVSMQDLPVRLARYLLGYLEEHDIPVKNNQAIIELSFPKKDLANKLGTIPETLSRTFAKLNGLGYVDVSGKTILIRNIEDLKAFSL
ncbi:MAG TPA: hypothetical protein DF296_12925 [Candidatus Margulisbacteria bacterium]|nr:MAG: hypothetical protein A2X43_02125 [Candidatus Margulisbacteria bacterium GWD2_39_127]OGI00872.1 MAG: hypothetical protein A2X42_03000 [Candidatus Margulisbacteria bacterium GWF2_38_17]OGI08727.1 MAG: hypothetical protein A2X41_05255 [Candidatus Margulisbacteria bacterium GWE2_39_32]HAR63509.1 hypothetical protein [Candidatus Margulisiibacteriota bacterium]HCT86087.1 hypothetical protein [Candidatus Margulisiibacteriota bacterium]